MTWSNEITLWCDGEECEEWRQFTVSKVTDARHWAEERHNWDCNRGRDLCPDCS